jgi:hypothetical protein
MKEGYIHTKEHDGRGGFNCYLTQTAPVKETETPRHGHTASGYGARIPTRYMVYYRRRWRRVYAICYSNASTLFIGKKYDCRLTVTIEEARQ